MPANLQTKQAHARIRQDPDYFFEKWLGVWLWEKEREIVHSIRDHRKTAVRSCHSSGKTFTIARAALWFLYAFPPAIVIDTAPTDRQVRNQFWREFRGAHQRALRPLGGNLLKTQFNLDENWYAMGFSTRETTGEDVADKFQGFHGKNILFVVDEAAGVPESIFEAIAGGMSGGAVVRLAYVGNPTRVAGAFADAFKDSSFKKIHISAFDVPNVQKGATLIPGLATKEWVEEMKAQYGEESDVYRVRVLGEFPKAESDSLIPLERVERALQRSVLPFGEKIMGVDVARFGQDKSVLLVRQGDKVLEIRKITKADTMAVTGEVINMMRKHELKAENVAVDSVGIGAGVVDRLHEQGFRVFGVNLGERAKNPEQYANLRAQLYDLVRDALKELDLFEDEEFYQLANIKYRFNSTGKLLLESKEEMKKRGLPSPDLADALVLSYAKEGGVAAVPGFLAYMQQKAQREQELAERVRQGDELAQLKQALRMNGIWHP